MASLRGIPLPSRILPARPDCVPFAKAVASMPLPLAGQAW
jgi:hypothetical protein